MKLKRCLQRGTEAKKRELVKKAKKYQRLASIDEGITQLNLKKSSLEEAIKGYLAEADKYTYNAEK